LGAESAEGADSEECFMRPGYLDGRVWDTPRMPEQMERLLMREKFYTIRQSFWKKNFSK